MLRSFENLMIYIFIFISFHFFKTVSGGCQFQEHNLEILSTNSPWLAWNYPHGPLEISLCKPLLVSNCEKNASICYDGNRTFANFDNSSIVSSVPKTEQFSLQIEGNKCSMENKANAVMIIYFKCGKSLGFPKFLSEDICRIALEWQTTAACKDGSELARIETTKCYGYNSQQLFINLDTLDDEYEVEVGGDDDDIDDDDDDGIENIKGTVLKLAVCRNMHSGESCPGFGACLMKNSMAFNLGKISKEVAVNADDSLTISYLDRESNMPGCKEVTTTINFFCPERGIGSKPRLLPSSRCKFSINWETEAACPVQSTTTNSGCVLRSSKHVVDLTSLGSDELIKLTAEDENGDSIEFQLYICSDKLITCGEKRSSACQINLKNNNIKSIGNFSKQIFRYSDGALQMVMDGGEPCGTGFYRNTIINFHCDSDKSVTFDFEDKCSYFFNWKTPLACLTPSISCSLRRGGMNFDLSGLTKTDAEENWKTADDSIILNICRGLTPGDPLARNCSSGAICRKDGSKHVNYGRRMEGLIFNGDRGAIQLDYVDGEACSPDKRFNASLLLFCDPNVANSQPYLVGNSSDGCHIDLEWHSSLACGSGHITGRNCLVKDLMTGLQFDLSPLRLDSSKKSWYKVETSEYDYFINICGPLKDTPCSQANAGVCQVSKKSNQIIHSTGRWSDELHYVNGILRLAYKDGDNYNSEPPVPRHTDIEFVCNSRAGLGEPLFVMETNRTYKFLWHTVLACSRNFVECSSFVSGGQTFDLSFLVQQGSRQNWQMTASLDGKSYKLFLNLCRGLLIGPETKSCDPFHSACLIPSNNNEAVISLGRPRVQPLVKSSVVILTYEQGSVCEGDRNSNYSLQLNLHCSKAAQSSPSSFEKISPCMFRINWYTSSACPVTERFHDKSTHDFNDSNCVLVLDQSGQTFDITKFRGRTFDASHNLGSYKISLCGESSECGPGMVACKMDGEKVKEFVKVDGRKLSMNADGSPQLQLESDKIKFLIHFKCNMSIANENLMFLETRSDWLLFSFSTPLACFGRTTSCQVFDESGNKYDLEPLAKLTGSWRAVNPFGDFCDFNLCRPLLSSDEPACRSAGSCLRKRTGGAMNGGHISNLLEVTSEGALRITYSGGETCGGGKRSTLIMLKCSSVRHEPLLLTDVGDCEAVIQWVTPFACPNKVSHAVGWNCRVRHPTYSIQAFDLSELKESKDYEIDFDEGKYLIRVCKEVQDNQQCKNMKAGACLVSGGEALNMGTSNDRLEYRDGRISLRYSAAVEMKTATRLSNCTDGISTEIEFKCEHDNLGISSGPIYVSGSCHRKFEWVTSLACFKYRKVPCRVEDANGTVFDLSPLTLHDSNYEVETDRGETKFIINVCTTLVLTEGNSCPPNSAACEISTGKSIGNLPGDDGARKGTLSIEGEKVRMVYEGDEASSTIVYFMCDPWAPETTTPRFLLKEGRTFVFTWSTRLVCKSNNQDQSNYCSVLDPMTGHLYNLSSIRGPHEFEGYGRTFNVSICSCYPDGPCPAGQSTPWLLTYEHGTIMLRYSGGQSCSDPNKTSSTVVSIVCPSEGEEEVKQFEAKNENCMHVFTWKNRLACRKELKCLVQGSGFNLSPLMKHQGGHTAETSVGGVSKALINVCTHLPAETGCNPLAAVCIMKDGQFLSGGRVMEEPKYDVVTKEVSLTYSDGDKCSDRTWSSKIIFLCSQISDLNPYLSSLDENNCLITFLWKTEFVCQMSLPLADSSLKDCKLKLDNDSYDISDLSAHLETQTVRSKWGTVKIRLCSEFQEDVCASSAVCLFNQSAPVKGFGVKSNTKILKEGKDVKITYTLKTCKDLLTDDLASLIFICDKSGTTPSIEILYETSCSIIINIKNSFACLTVDSSIKHPSQAPNLPELPHDTGHSSYTAYVVVAVIIVCILFVIAGILIRRKKRNQRGYEPVDAMHYFRDCEGMNSPLFQSEDHNASGLQNYASDDDLML